MFAEPLPTVGITEILGLLKVLDDAGSRADVYRLAQQLQLDTAALLPVLRGAEMLSFVHTPGGDVVLQPLGKQVVDADMNTKKAIVKEQMEKLPLVRFFMEFLSNHPEKAVEKSEILEELAILIPSADPEELYGTLLKWGRYGEIFGFSYDTGRFFLNTRGRRRRPTSPGPSESGAPSGSASPGIEPPESSNP
ncbi:MAG: AAA-associated domain-containing protein [Planctomycetes bacterium]|nr:AAA-associated domain-containing protein [Planctomycetota bacterium]